MDFSRERLQRVGRDTGFDPRYLERVQRLLRCLELANEHEVLQEQFLLKGGTALNLFYFQLPRLSVDIDLNFIGTGDVDNMKEMRPDIIQGMEEIFQRLDLAIENEPNYAEHAGITWELSYRSALGGRNNMKVDLNFLMRVPLFPTHERGLSDVKELSDVRFQVHDIHELAGGKLRALLERTANRDLYDCYQLLYDTALDQDRLRLAFVVYGAISRRDWREISTSDIDYRLEDVKNNLLHVLRAEERAEIHNSERWISKLTNRCREEMRALLQFTKSELKFLKGINEKGRIRPELLTENERLQKNIKNNPALMWKVQNVRGHYDLHGAGEK